jgi:hypothetical protein
MSYHSRHQNPGQDGSLSISGVGFTMLGDGEKNRKKKKKKKKTEKTI